MSKSNPANRAELDLVCALAADSLAAYAQLLWPQYQLGRHHAEIIRVLEAVEQGKEDRVVILCPPRHGKSLTVSQFFPAWYMGRHPEDYVIIASYGQDLAEDFGGKIRNHMQDPLHRMVFPQSQLATDSQAKDRFATTKGGVCFAVGRGSATTGRGAHLLVLDDTVKDQQEAKSERVRRDLKDWFTSVAYTRLMPGGKIIICQTLWHEDDLAGWLMREQMHDGWKVVRFPAIAEEDDAWRKKGEALWPEKWPLDRLERIRDRSGMRTEEWMSLYQQRCVSDDGSVFKLAWLREAFLPREFLPEQVHQLAKVIVCDPANSKKRGSDNTAMWVLGLGADHNVYVLDAVRDQLGLRERADMLFSLHRTWRPIQRVFYEEYGLQSDIQYIKERQGGLNGSVPYHFHITPVGGKVRKEERIRRLEPWFRDGRIKMPRHMMRRTNDGREIDITKAFEEEYKAFPVGAHDDLFDALARIADPDINLDWPTTPEELKQREHAIRKSMGSGGRNAWMAA